MTINEKTRFKLAFASSSLLIVFGLAGVAYKVWNKLKPETEIKVPAISTSAKVNQDIFKDIARIYDKRYVISFTPTVDRATQRKILNDFPAVKYLKDGIFPEVVLVKIEDNAPALLEKLQKRMGIDWVEPDRPRMACH